MVKLKIIVHRGARNQKADEAKCRQDAIAACEEAYEVLQRQNAVELQDG